MRYVTCAVLLLTSLPGLARAEETLSPQMVTVLKAATVFVKIKSGELAGSGSGFVIRAEGDSAYIVTNRHVVEPKVAQVVVVPVARITEADSQNLGLAIPSRAVVRLLHGRLDKTVLTAVRDGDDRMSIKVTAALIDPFNKIKSATLHYLSAVAVADKPKPSDPLKALPGCRTLELKLEDGVASGTISLKKGVTEVDGLSGASQTVVMAGTTQQFSGLCSVEIVDTSSAAGGKKAPPAVPPAPAAPPEKGSAGMRPTLQHEGENGSGPILTR